MRVGKAEGAVLLGLGLHCSELEACASVALLFHLFLPESPRSPQEGSQGLVSRLVAGAPFFTAKAERVCQWEEPPGRRRGHGGISRSERTSHYPPSQQTSKRQLS